MIELPNHGKRSLALDLAKPDGREILMELCSTADVFLTNWLPQTRRKLQVEVDNVRAANPSIIYARGSGFGQRGQEAQRSGFDGSVFWARAGVVEALTKGDRADPYGPRITPGFGDMPGGQMLAGAVAAALFQRERTGEPSVIDLSLLGVGMWTMAPFIVATKLYDLDEAPYFHREDPPNPIANTYLTSDGRALHLMMLQYDRHAKELFAAIGHPELGEDPRFWDFAAVQEHRRELVAILDEVFATRPLVEWKLALSGLKGAWEAAQTAREVNDDPQAIENGYFLEVDYPGEPASFTLVANPVQFDESPVLSAPRAPEHGQHTEEILLELGHDWDEIAKLKDTGAVL
jgi:crotonobetainyl-CoA:carnitine CoA-transferase CaiB-like acyl-CoA transferase